MGSPQGSILSPLLSNIYLHEFDKFMENYITEFNKGKTRKTNPAYFMALRKHGIKEARKVGYTKRVDDSFRRMNYVRYADDFVITIIGSKADAIEIKKKCGEFLSSMKLSLSEEKTLITNPKDNSVAFLGYLIQNSPYKVREYSRRYNNVWKKIRMNAPGGIYLKVDSNKVKLRFHEKGFCKRNGEPIPNFKYLANTQQATILQMSYILRGLANYYKLANNVRQMISRWNYLIRFSVAKVFAAKYKLDSVAKVFARAGKDLGKPLKVSNLKEKSKVIGQTEEKIWEYLKTIGIKKNTKKSKPKAQIGIPYTRYKEIPLPDLAPLSKKFNPTF